MKVLFINAVCGTGSTGNIVAEMIQFLRSNDDQGLAAYGVGKSQKVLSHESYKINHLPGYYLHNALSRLTDHTGCYSVLQTLKLVRNIRKFDPDVVHLHNLHGYYVNYEILFRFLARQNKPVVWTLHDCWAMTGHCAHFSSVGCEQWKTGCRDCSLLREYPVCYTRGDVVGNYLRKKAAFTSVSDMNIVTPSAWLADLAGESFLRKYPIQVIHNGIDIKVFRSRESSFRTKYGLEGYKVVLGVANVWSPKKGLEDMFALAKRLPQEYRMVLVGLTDDQCRDLPDGILGICRTANREALAEIYSTADIFVNPSYEDTYPTVNLEAQACGTPVICYDVCGCPETILPGCGETVPTGDADAVLDGILRWCSRERPICPDVSMLDKTASYEAYYALYRRAVQRHRERS